MPLPLACTRQDQNVSAGRYLGGSKSAPANVRAISRAITAIENHAAGSRAAAENSFSAHGYSLSHRHHRRARHRQEHARRSPRRALSQAGNRRSASSPSIPRSPYTGGAILGDRIRMQGHAGDAGIFIRSMATRGFLGGLAVPRPMLRCFSMRRKGKSSSKPSASARTKSTSCASPIARCRARSRSRRRRAKHEGRPDGNRRHFRAQ